MFFKKAADGSSVYVGGNFNPKVMNLTMDGGGFYDLDHNVNSPPGGMCDGYDSFYNQVNPIDGIFCIKCCKGITECDIPLGISGGCPAQAPGDYTAKIFPQGILPITGRSLSNPGVPQPSDGAPASSGSTSGSGSSSPGSPTGSAKSEELKNTISTFVLSLFGLIL
jgi:hypothetical protein